MNKRLRKKRHVGEFQEMGFLLRFRIPGSSSEAEQDRFADQCIGHVESLGLNAGGGIGEQWNVFVASDSGSVSSDQRDSLIAWLTARPDVLDIEAGPLIDAWVSQDPLPLHEHPAHREE